MSNIIKLENVDTDTFSCSCGNNVDSDGFDPCDEQGVAMVPTPSWDNHYVCNRCGLVYHIND